MDWQLAIILAFVTGMLAWILWDVIRPMIGGDE